MNSKKSVLDGINGKYSADVLLRAVELMRSGVIPDIPPEFVFGDGNGDEPVMLVGEAHHSCRTTEIRAQGRVAVRRRRQRAIPVHPPVFRDRQARSLYNKYGQIQARTPGQASGDLREQAGKKHRDRYMLGMALPRDRRRGARSDNNTREYGAFRSQKGARIQRTVRYSRGAARKQIRASIRRRKMHIDTALPSGEPHL